MDVSRAERERVVERFLAAVTTGDTQGLMEVLALGVVLVADGGSLVPAARRPIEGMERVASVLSHFSRVAPGAEMATLLLNGAVAARIEMDGEFSAAVAFVVEDGRIASIYVVVNPRKLSRLGEEVRLSRA